MSSGSSARGPWNQGQGPWPKGESWSYIEDPLKQVLASRGEKQARIEGTERTEEQAQKLNRERSKSAARRSGAPSPRGKTAGRPTSRARRSTGKRLPTARRRNNAWRQGAGAGPRWGTSCATATAWAG